MALWRVVRMARAAIFAVSAVLLLLAALIVPGARTTPGATGFAIDLMLGLLTVAGLFLSFLVLWSAWVQGVVLQFRLRRLAFARVLLGLFFVLAVLPLLVFASEVHRFILIAGFAGALIGFLLHAMAPGTRRPQPGPAPRRAQPR